MHDRQKHALFRLPQSFSRRLSCFPQMSSSLIKASCLREVHLRRVISLFRFRSPGKPLTAGR